MSINACAFTISNTPGTSGAFTVSAADTGPVRAPAAAHDGQVCRLFIYEGTAFEVRSGAIYTHSGTSMSRGTLVDSSTGSAISFTSAAIVHVIGWDADTADRAMLGAPAIVEVGSYVIASADESGNSTIAIAANNLYIQPFVLAAPATVSGMQCSVTTGSSGNLRMGLYRAVADGTLELVAEIATQIDTTSASDKSSSFSANVTLEPGQYVVGYVGSGTPTFRGGVSGAPFGVLAGNLNNGGLGAYRNALTYPGAMPSTIDATGWNKSLYIANRPRVLLTGV
jgi:hypothetical protein